MRAFLQKCARRPVSWHTYLPAGHRLAAIVNSIEGELDQAEATQEAPPSPMEAMPDAAGLNTAEPLTDRHYWIVTQVGQGTRLTWKHVMEQFCYSERHAKRILGVLRERGLIQFRHAPKPGYHVLCKKEGRHGS